MTRDAQTAVVAVLTVVGLGLFWGPERSAHATSRPMTTIVTPATNASVATANTAYRIGGTAQYCSLVIWNNSATPIYVGGDTVNTSTGMPLCTNTALCRDSMVALDTQNAWITAGSIVAATVRYIMGTGCSTP